MKWEKIAVLVVLGYLAIALPLYLFNQQAVKECETTCNEEGCDIVISAENTGQNIKCNCFDSLTRKEKIVIIS